MVVDMAENLKIEFRNVLNSLPDEKKVENLLHDQNILLQGTTLREYCEKELDKAKNVEPEDFNDDTTFRTCINDMLSIKELSFPNVKLTRDQIEKLGEGGKDAAILAEVM